MSSPEPAQRKSWKTEWPEGKMREAIAQFRSSGDPGACLELLGEPAQPQLALQHALSRARNRLERDAFEDISFALAKEPSDTAPAHRIGEILAGVGKEYGDLAADFARPALESLLAAVYAHGRPAPPLECLIAAAGLLARELAKATFLDVRDEHFDATVMLTSNDCVHCGGKPEGPCQCQVQVTIPWNPRHGEIIKGHRMLSSEEVFYCLRLADEESARS